MPSLESEILRAFEEGEFFPVFQPIVEMRTGALVGFEALARWNHQRLGFISPDDFIPIVEKSGLIDRLTKIILEKAFASPSLAHGSHTLAVNISPTQLLGLQSFDWIADVAKEHGFSLDRLTIEITESALVDDLDRAKAVADELKALQCRLALDDFGTGYSSLKHLHALPFDELKIDRSFVGSMMVKRESRKIVSAVIGLGQSLGLKTVAEGVETQEQADMLFRMACDMGQGWLYGKPAPASEIPSMVSLEKWTLRTPSPDSRDEASILRTDALPSERFAQLQAIYDGAPVGLCFLDKNLRYVSLNRRLAAMNGVPTAEHIGRTPREIIPEAFPQVEPYIRRALGGEAITGVEVRKPPAQPGESGQRLLISYQPARDEGGEVLGVSVAIMDVTASKWAEEALRESENHYRHMVHLNPHVPWVLDARGEVIEASPRWEKFTGQPIQEALGNGWIRMLHPDDVGSTVEAIRKALDTGGPIDIEYRISNSGDSWRWMRSRGAPRFSDTGEIVGIYGIVEEVHPQKQVSEELEISLVKLSAAVEACPIGMILADAHDCTIFMVNPIAKRITAGTVFVGQKLSEYTHLAVSSADGMPLQPEEFPIYRSLMRGETVENQHLLFCPTPDVQLHLSVSSKPILSDDGHLIGCVVILNEFDTSNQFRIPEAFSDVEMKQPSGPHS